MRFTISRKPFYTAVSAVSKVINAKNSLSILDNFLCTLAGDTLTVTGADMDNELSAHVDVADSDGDTKFCLPARRLVELLKELPDTSLVIEMNDQTFEVLIKYPGGQYNMMAISGMEYPVYRADDDDNAPMEFDITAESLLQGLDYTIFAVGDDDYRPMMKGVLFDIKPDRMIYVATDTHKLVRFTDHRVAPGIEASCIVPVKPANILRNIVSKDEKVHVSMTRKSATLTTEKMVFRCSFLNGRFPPYERVIPTQSPFTLTFDRVATLNAVRRVAIFVDPGHGLEKFKITPEHLEIKSDDNGMGTAAREVVPCGFDGPETVIGFSAPFLIEFLGIIPTDEVVVELADPSRAGVFTPAENIEGTELVMLLMPMNVDKF
ncbi:MAG: DNA polymerase III subunit beta [Muribaculaceae bacterium]|nr:DNA polymerase III subunit beta [Muribaculaceae bacterium]